jgi:Ser/Thr protein kinase RdoA (MazF antagonist)
MPAATVLDAASLPRATPAQLQAFRAALEESQGLPSAPLVASEDPQVSRAVAAAVANAVSRVSRHARALQAGRLHADAVLNGLGDPQDCVDSLDDTLDFSAHPKSVGSTAPLEDLERLRGRAYTNGF